jgi:PAS domain S-box-containing protein
MPELAGWDIDTEGFLTAVLDGVAQPVWVVDHEGAIRFANPAAIAALGYDDLSELYGRLSHDTIHYKHRDGSPFPAAECPMLAPRTTGETVHSDEDWFVRRNGSMFPVSYWSAPLETPAGRGAVVAFTDIEERRQVEHLLRERDAILETVAEPVFVTDPTGNIRYANPAAVAALGYDDASEMVGQNEHRLVHHKRADGSPFPIEECELSRPRKAGDPAQLGEDWFVRKDGSMVPLAYIAAPLAGPSGVGTVIAFEDVTERRETERMVRERGIAEARAAELAASETRQRAILEAALDCVISIDANGCVTYFNRAAERSFGYDANEVIGRELAELVVPPAHRDAHRAGLARQLAGGESSILDQRIELTAMRADGSTFPAEVTITRINLPGAPTFTGYVRDITERKLAEQNLEAARLRVIEAGDAARRRVTRDLHDGAQQRFVNSLVNLQLAQRKLGAVPAESAELLELASDEARAGMADLRELAAGIHPAVLTDRGLDAALDVLRARLPIAVRCDVAVDRLPQAIEASIYFFCSEALTNVVKHAGASSAKVAIADHGGVLDVLVSDDGVGGATMGSGGTGLLGLNDRVSALGGELEIVSPANHGTVLRASIPLERNADPTTGARMARERGDRI